MFRHLAGCLCLFGLVSVAAGQDAFRVTAEMAGVETLSHPKAVMTLTRVATDIYEQKLDLGPVDYAVEDKGKWNGVRTMQSLAACMMLKVTKALGKSAVYETVPTRQRPIGSGLVAFVTPGEPAERFADIPEFSPESVQKRLVRYSDLTKTIQMYNTGQLQDIRCKE